MKFTLYKRLIFYRGLFATLILLAGFFSGSYYHEITHAPDLHRLYMQSMKVTDQPPVIFIHGVMGSKLRDNKNQKKTPN